VKEDQELRKLLEQIRQELEHTESVDEKGRDLLHALDADIHELLERSEASQSPSIPSRLEEAIAHFEVDHPSLTSALSQLLASLSNAGI
jgi:hypothetical protein